jgi:hypothetical protein
MIKVIILISLLTGLAQAKGSYYEDSICVAELERLFARKSHYKVYCFNENTDVNETFSFLTKKKKSVEASKQQLIDEMFERDMVLAGEIQFGDKIKITKLFGDLESYDPLLNGRLSYIFKSKHAPEIKEIISLTYDKPQYSEFASADLQNFIKVANKTPMEMCETNQSEFIHLNNLENLDRELRTKGYRRQITFIPWIKRYYHAKEGIHLRATCITIYTR